MSSFITQWINVLNIIYATRVIPKDWLLPTCITLPKKSKTSNMPIMGLALMTDMVKVFLGIIYNIIFAKTLKSVTIKLDLEEVWVPE